MWICECMSGYVVMWICECVGACMCACKCACVCVCVQSHFTIKYNYSSDYLIREHHNQYNIYYLVYAEQKQ